MSGDTRETHRDLQVVAVVGLAALIAVLLTPAHNPLRVVLGLALVLVLPGYPIATKMHQPMHPRARRPSEQLLLTCGLSLAITVLSGLLLNLTPLGISQSSMAGLLVLITEVTCAIAVWRRPSALARIEASSTLTPAPTSPSPSLAWRRHAVLLGFAGLVTAGALVAAGLGATHKPAAGFTQLWMLPSSDNSGQVVVGVRSQEPTSTRFRVRLLVDGRKTHQWRIRLAPGAQWGTTVAVPPGTRAQVLLYQVDGSSATTPYRQAFLAGNEQAPR
jgi:uncharacterized membrane protein